MPNNLLILKKTVDTAKQFMSNQQIGQFDEEVGILMFCDTPCTHTVIMNNFAE